MPRLMRSFSLCHRSINSILSHNHLVPSGSLFIAHELEKLESVNQLLKKEVLSLKEQLGVDDGLVKGIDSLKFSSATVTAGQNKIAPNKDTPSVEPKKTEKTEVRCNSAKPAIVTDDEVDVGRLDMRVGRILEVKKHPDADSLYVETIDLGEEKPRIVVSGLVKHVPLEEMQNRLVICLCNLKPAKMRGVESQAMVMCASSAEKVEIMEVDPSCVPGDIVEYGSFIRRPDAVINPKKKVWEAVAADLKVSNEGFAVYKDQTLAVKQKRITAPTLRNVPVK